jgi:hypothetical protein
LSSLDVNEFFSILLIYHVLNRTGKCNPAGEG